MNDIQPWRRWSSFQVKTLYQINFGHVFNGPQNGFGIRLPVFDLIVAMLVIRKSQAKRFYGVPETYVIHRFKPLLNIIYIPEFFHEFRIPIPSAFAQIRI